MREKLVRSDWVDCVIGLGPNLFYNSPMEACIVICRTKKPDTHKNHVLFINGLNEVTRKNAQSYLEPHHIERIAKAYRAYKTEEGFARKVSIRDIEKNEACFKTGHLVVTNALKQQKKHPSVRCKNTVKFSLMYMKFMQLSLLLVQPKSRALPAAR